MLLSKRLPDFSGFYTHICCDEAVLILMLELTALQVKFLSVGVLISSTSISQDLINFILFLLQFCHSLL